MATNVNIILPNQNKRIIIRRRVLLVFEFQLEWTRSFAS